MSSEQIITPHPVGRVSPEGVTRQLAGDAESAHVGLRDKAANPTYGGEWQIHRLAELASFKYGKFLAKSTLNETGFPVFSGYGVVGYLPEYEFDDPQLLIVCRGEGGTGDVKMSPPEMFYHQLINSHLP